MVPGQREEPLAFGGVQKTLGLLGNVACLLGHFDGGFHEGVLSRSVKVR